MSKLVPALLAVLVVGGAAAAAWLALREGPQIPPEPPAPAQGTRSAVRTVSPGPAATPPRPPTPPEPGDPPVKPAKPVKAVKPWDPGPPLVEPKGEPVPGAGLHFTFPQWPEVSKFDWTRLGLELRKSQRLLRECAVRLSEGDPLEKVRSDIDVACMPLIRAVLEQTTALMIEDIDSRDVAGSICALPPIESNALAAVLDAWGRPLSEEQSKAVGKLYMEYALVWLGNRAAPGEQWSLDAFATIAAARAALQPKLEEILDASQRDALWPPETKGRMALDLFSVTQLCRGRVLMVQCEDEASVAFQITHRLLAETGLGHMDTSQLAPTTEAWLASLPPEWRRGPRDRSSRTGLLTWDELAVGVRESPRLLRALETAKPRRDPRFLRVRYIFVPVVAAR
jgi:hypothetical protein